MDGGRNRIVLATLVTPAAIQDNQPMLDLARWVHFRWQLDVDMAVGDSKYGSIDNIVGLLQDGVVSLTPRTDYNSGKQFYSNDRFHYDAEKDIYLCPQGNPLKRQGVYQANRSIVYGAKPTFVIHVRSGQPVPPTNVGDGSIAPSSKLNWIRPLRFEKHLCTRKQ